MRFGLVLLLCVFFSKTYAQSTPSFAEKAVELSSSQSLPLAPRIQFELTSSNSDKIAQSLQQWKGISTKQKDSDTLLVTMSERPLFTGEALAQYSANSFVIDIEEESTKGFVSGFTKAQSKPWKLDALTKYVNGYIDDTTYIHGFNFASVVAEQRSGDCTEYAVLVTALARSLGFPSRVIVGTVIIEEKTKVSAFGHAWAEVFHEGQWQIVDAALYESQGLKHFYLPASKLENEGPGFGMSLMKAVILMPDSIKGLRDHKES